MTLSEKVQDTVERRLVNSEYKRGFMEGSQSVLLAIAKFIDDSMSQFDTVANHNIKSSCTQEIKSNKSPC